MIFTKNHLILFFVISSTLISCGEKANKKTANEIKTLPVYEINSKDTLVDNKFVADVHAKKNVTIHVRLAGLLEKVFVNEGQKVKKGQLLFKISDLELQIQLLQAEAVYKSMQADFRIATVELDQAQTLFNKKVIADNELELSKAKHDAARAKLSHASAEKKSAIQKIEFTSIRAPFDGVIDRIPFKEGSLVEKGDLLTSLSDLSEVYAYFSIPENIYFQMMGENRLVKNGDIQLILPNRMLYPLKGELAEADSEINRETGSIQYKAKFKNPEGFIKHGTSGKLIISEPRTDAILIPQKSVFAIQDKQFVFVVGKNNTVKMKNIIIGNTLNDSYIVEKGLANKDLIVVEGTQSLKDGSTIKIKGAGK